MPPYDRTLLPATASADQDARKGYWLSPVVACGSLWAFELLDGERKSIAQFLYPTRDLADDARLSIATATWQAHAIIATPAPAA